MPFVTSFISIWWTRTYIRSYTSGNVYSGRVFFGSLFRNYILFLLLFCNLSITTQRCIIMRKRERERRRFFDGPQPRIQILVHRTVAFTAAWGTLNGTKERAFSIEERAASDFWLALTLPDGTHEAENPRVARTLATVSRVYSSPALRLDATTTICAHPTLQ